MTDPFDDWLHSQRVEPLAPRPGAYELVARSARRRRTGRFAMTSAAVGVALVAGGGLAFRLATAPVPDPAPAGSSSASPATRSSEPSGAATQDRPPSAGATGTATGSGTATNARCRTADVQVTHGRPGRGDEADGNQHDWIVFTNTGDHACTLLGYPGVSWIAGPDAATVNKPAVRDFSRQTAARITLAPQQQAHAEIFWPRPDAVANCNPVRIDGYRVYVPDEKASVFVAAPFDVCSTEGVGLATIEPVVLP
ncbi:DUF4232 domain-containing protein [Dactylosporangium sp. CA-139066]|uniref:DUF4232 domain-containing protein n=1 Tax=Dactylosporangium sp. CA-139066 TaxID=3239930 RepID=UPI003D91D644